MFQLLHTSCSNSQLCTGDVNLSTKAASFACLGGDKTHNLATGCPLVWVVFLISNIDCKGMMSKVLLKDRGKILHQNMD